MASVVVLQSIIPVAAALVASSLCLSCHRIQCSAAASSHLTIRPSSLLLLLFSARSSSFQRRLVNCQRAFINTLYNLTYLRCSAIEAGTLQIAASAAADRSGASVLILFHEHRHHQQQQRHPSPASPAVAASAAR